MIKVAIDYEAGTELNGKQNKKSGGARPALWSGRQTNNFLLKMDKEESKWTALILVSSKKQFIQKNEIYDKMNIN